MSASEIIHAVVGAVTGGTLGAGGVLTWLRRREDRLEAAAKAKDSQHQAEAAPHIAQAAASAADTGRYQVITAETRLAEQVVAQFRADFEAMRRDLQAERDDRQRTDRELEGERAERRRERDQHVQAIADLTAANAALREQIERLRQRAEQAEQRAEAAERRAERLKVDIEELRKESLGQGHETAPRERAANVAEAVVLRPSNPREGSGR